MGKQLLLRQGFGRDTPQAYKIVSVVGGRPLAMPLGERGRKINVYSPLKLLCYYIDFGGSRFECVSDTFTFRPFDNEMTITDLDAYPLANASLGDAQGEEAMLEALKTRGRSFIEVTEASHRLYEGLAYSDGNTKEEVRSHAKTRRDTLCTSAWREMLTFLQINTPVIIDFALAYQNAPSLLPNSYYPNIDYFNRAGRDTRAELFEVVHQTRIFARKWDWVSPPLLLNSVATTQNQYDVRLADFFSLFLTGSTGANKSR